MLVSHFRKKVDSSSCPQLVGRGNLVASGKNEAITTFGCNRFWRISTAQGFVLKPFQSNIKGNRDVSAFYLREGRLYQIGWILGALNRTFWAWNWYKHCQRHNGPEGWVHITESWLSINFKSQPNISISTKSKFKILTKPSYTPHICHFFTRLKFLRIKFTPKNANFSR